MENHAKREFEILKKTVPDAVIIPFEKEIIAMCKAFEESGQSGGSAPYVANAIASAVKKLMLYEPLTALTDDDDMWADVSEDLLQHKRCSALFKEKSTGRADYLYAIVFNDTEDNWQYSGSAYINDKYFTLVTSRQYVKFPFTPKTFYVDVIKVNIEKEKAEELGINYIEHNDKCYYNVLKSPEQLEEVFKYYEQEGIYQMLERDKLVKMLLDAYNIINQLVEERSLHTSNVNSMYCNCQQSQCYLMNGSYICVTCNKPIGRQS